VAELLSGKFSFPVVSFESVGSATLFNTYPAEFSKANSDFAAANAIIYVGGPNFFNTQFTQITPPRILFTGYTSVSNGFKSRIYLYFDQRVPSSGQKLV